MSEIQKVLYPLQNDDNFLSKKMKMRNSVSARRFDLSGGIAAPRAINTAKSPRRHSVKLFAQNQSNEIDPFGKDAAHITIGSSRKEEEPLELSPGPAAYDTFDYVRSTPLFTLKSRPDVDYSTPTSGCDIPDLSVYPRKLEKHIGLRISTEFWAKSDTPLAAYDIRPPSTPKITIRNKLMDPINDTPGPGAYSPRTPQPKYQTTFPRLRGRSTFESTADSPGPGHYNINRSLIGTEKWKGAIRPIKKWDYGEND